MSDDSLNRRNLLQWSGAGATSVAFASMARPTLAAACPPITAYRNPGCGCCEKWAARGLAVPGMPMGSPGMEMGGTAEKYDVLIFTAGGAREVYASH